MKIIRQTPTQLVLRSIPVWNWLAGSVCVITAIFFLGLSGLSNRFICERSAPNRGRCKLINSFPLLKPIEKELELADLKKSEVRAIDNNSKKIEYSVILHAQQNEIILYGKIGHFSENQNQKESIATQINDFIKNQEKLSLVVEEGANTPWWLLAIYLLHLGLGLSIIASKQIVVFKFDKNENKLTILEKGLLGVKKEQHDLSEIVAVRVEKLENQNWVYQSSIILTGDVWIHLTATQSLKANHKK